MSATADRLDVAETVYRYAVGIDTRDFVLYRSIFAPDVHIDFTSYSGGEPATMMSDAWVRRLLPVFGGLAATQHSMSNPITAIDGDGDGDLPDVRARPPRPRRRRRLGLVHHRRLLR